MAGTGGWISRLAHRHLALKQAYRQVFAGPAGEAVLADLLKACQMERRPDVANDPISTGVNIGLQVIGRHIQNNLHMPDGEIIRRANTVSDQTEGASHGEYSEETYS